MGWTEERIELLRRLWSEGKSASEISELLGDVTRNAVIGKAHRLNLDGRPSPIKKKPGHGATILALTEHMCKWPVGDPRSHDFHFCGAAAKPGFPYCGEHVHAAYQAAPKKREEERKVLTPTTA